MEPGEQKALEDIEKFGCHIIHVLEEGDLPPFSYSIGISKSLGKPELIIVGLRRELAHELINEYNRKLRAGELLRPGLPYSGFLEGFNCIFQPVHREHYEEYFGWAIWLYQGDRFEVLQLIYPSTGGCWPNAEDAPDAFKQLQTILSETGECNFPASLPARMMC